MHPIFLHYPISVPSKQINAQPYPTYVDQNNYYFIIPIQQEEDAIWEKYVISNHLHQNNFTNVTQPIRNIHNQFVTTVGKEKFLLCFARKKTNVRFLSRSKARSFSPNWLPISIPATNH